MNAYQRMKQFVLTILLTFITILSHAQCESSTQCTFFHHDQVSRIDITLDSTELENLLADVNDDKNVRIFGSLTYESKTIKDTLQSISIRLSQSGKYSLKLAL